MNQTNKILKKPKDNRHGVLNTELNKICFRYGARIYELRKEGYHITTERFGKGLCKYTLTQEPEEESKHVPA